jgi:AAA+ superfamily predicted ATPase
MAENYFVKELSEIIRAGFPFVYIQTFEEERAIKLLKNLCERKGTDGLDRPLYLYTQTQGLKRYPDGQPDESLRSPYQLFDYVENAEENAIYTLLDFHIFFSDDHPPPDDYLLIRRIRDLSLALRASSQSKAAVIISPLLLLPEELQKEVMVLEMPLPDQQEMLILLDRLIMKTRGTGSVSVYLTENQKELLCKAALGLTIQEAEGTFARAMVNDGVLDVSDVDYILAQKQQILKKSGALEYVGTDFNIDAVGGLENFKDWLSKRNGTWMDAAEKYNLPPPKGVLLTGIPGCGKSLCARAVSSLWKLPLLRFDMGSVFGKYIGESESNMRRALATAEALAPCILWIDEIEKGMGEQRDDTGTSRRVFGTFLTWMQEKKKPVFVFATANQINNLPPELLRKGRFDEIFFVDLPDLNERKQIFQVHLKRRLTSPEVKGEFEITDTVLIRLAELSEGFIGAEIEQAIVSALYDAFFDSREFRISEVEQAISKTIPLSVLQEDYVKGIRQWASSRAVPANRKRINEKDKSYCSSKKKKKFSPEKDRMKRKSQEGIPPGH